MWTKGDLENLLLIAESKPHTETPFTYSSAERLAFEAVSYESVRSADRSTEVLAGMLPDFEYLPQIV